MQAITAETVAALPPPTHENRDTSSRAERLARDFLLEGRASLWSAVRQVVRDLGYMLQTPGLSPPGISSDSDCTTREGLLDSPAKQEGIHALVA